MSALQIVAVAMCIQSSKIVYPTTFSATYFAASVKISSVTITLSVFCFGKFIKCTFACSGAFNNSVLSSLKTHK